MPQGIGGSGIVGIAFEATAGTYVAPIKYVPINSETMHMVEDTQFRRPIRQAVDAVNAVPGNEHPEGDIVMDARDDCVPYFMYAARLTVAKTGAGPFTYTCTPNSSALPTATRTMSITVVRGDQIFGYVGCVVTSYKFSIDNGVLLFTATIMGRQEATQSLPTATWPATTPFGMGQYSIEIPTATPVTDTDTFEFSCDDAGSVEFRLKSTGRGADFIRFGERTTQLTLARDFVTRADYDLFKAITSQSITVTATKGASASISVLIPVSFKTAYELGLSGQGDLIRANLTYQPIIDGATPPKPFLITIITSEVIT